MKMITALSTAALSMISMQALAHEGAATVSHSLSHATPALIAGTVLAIGLGFYLRVRSKA